MDINLVQQSIRSFAEATFSRSGGPGGQNVNKVNTKVTLKLKIDVITGLTSTESDRIKLMLANRINTEGYLVITSDEERTQRVNLERAYSRMEALITATARLPKVRRPTKPSRAAKEARLKAKKRQAEKKVERRLNNWQR